VLAQESIAAGVGFSAGIFGVEALFRPGAGGVLLGAGAGAAGVGARVLLPLTSGAEMDEGVATRRYVSLGYLLTPWSLGNIDAAGAVGAEVGVLVQQPNGRLFADLAVGAAVPHGGTWGGNTLSPLVRLQLGVRTRR
jgi:hypothetical protein